MKDPNYIYFVSHDEDFYLVQNMLQIAENQFLVNLETEKQFSGFLMVEFIR